jgi:mRNA interferase RelE/StbE
VPWRLEFDPGVLKDLKRLGGQDQRFIMDSLDKIVSAWSPAYVRALSETGKLKTLSGQWKGFSRLRLRTYRVILKEQAHRLVILVVRVGHRREAYR